MAPETDIIRWHVEQTHVEKQCHSRKYMALINGQKHFKQCFQGTKQNTVGQILVQKVK